MTVLQFVSFLQIDLLDFRNVIVLYVLIPDMHEDFARRILPKITRCMDEVAEVAPRAVLRTVVVATGDSPEVSWLDNIGLIGLGLLRLRLLNWEHAGLLLERLLLLDSLGLNSLLDSLSSGLSLSLHSHLLLELLSFVHMFDLIDCLLGHLQELVVRKSRVFAQQPHDLLSLT